MSEVQIIDDYWSHDGSLTQSESLGRNRGLLELDLKLDDLLEMQKDNQEDLDLEYVQFNVTKVLALLNKRFARKKGW